MKTEFATGQVWHYHSRPQDVGSRIIIGLLETDPRLGQLVHIQVTGVVASGPLSDSPSRRVISHLPISAEALSHSVTDLDSAAIPNLSGLREGYERWRADFDRGEAGIFTIPVREIVEIFEAALETP